MSIVTINDEYIKDIADSIRQKSGTNDTFKPNEMANAIKSISAGKPVLEDIVINPSVNEQVITPSSSYDGINQVKVNAVTSAIDNDIKPENIKKGVSILDIDGTLEVGTAEPNLQTKTVTPKTVLQTIKADNGYDGLSNVTVNAVTNEIDNNIRAENIKEGVSILGVVGNLQTGGGDTPSEVKGIVITESDEQGYALSVSTKGITNIPEYFFGNSNGLTQKLQTITLPNEVTSFSQYAFRGNTSVVNINIPQGITELPTGCFRGCTKLQMSVIPANVTVLNASAFQECQAITSLTFEGDVTYIGNGAFYRISKFEKLILPNVTGVATKHVTNPFSGTKITEGGSGYVYVPDHLVDSYKADSSWAVIASQIKGISEL